MLPNYTLVKLDRLSLESLINNSKELAIQHTVIQLSKDSLLSQDKISFFLSLSKKFRKNGMSFVVVHEGIDIDDFPDKLNIVPTLQEAEDVLEMEAIERDLGF